METFKTEWALAEPLVLGKRSADYYKNAAGKRLQSVTTLIKNLGWSGRALQIWANRQGLKGLDIQQALKPEAEAGTLAHYYCECFIKNLRPDLSKIPQETADEKKRLSEVSDRAQNAFLGFMSWLEREKPQWVASELKLVSEANQFGGTIDAVALIKGVLTLVDFKTANGIYSDHIIQVAAYRELLKEHRFDVQATMVLQIPKDDGDFMPHIIVEEKLQAGWKAFQFCQQVSPLKKILDSWKGDD